MIEAVGDTGTVVAADVAPEMLARARKTPADNISFLEADAHSLLLPDEAFNEIICKSAFPHFHDKAAAVAEMSRVLKPGGRLVICHPASREFTNNLHRSLGGPVADHILPDDETARGMLAAAGFKQISLEHGEYRYLLTARKRKGLTGIHFKPDQVAVTLLQPFGHRSRPAAAHRRLTHR